MLGAEMMLKALGLDPEKLQEQFGGVVQGMQQKFVQIENQLTRIEVAQVQILQNQMALAKALHIEGITDGEENGNPFRLGIDAPNGVDHAN